MDRIDNKKKKSFYIIGRIYPTQKFYGDTKVDGVDVLSKSQLCDLSFKGRDMKFLHSDTLETIGTCIDEFFLLISPSPSKRSDCRRLQWTWIWRKVHLCAAPRQRFYGSICDSTSQKGAHPWTISYTSLRSFVRSEYERNSRETDPHWSVLTDSPTTGRQINRKLLRNFIFRRVR